MTFEEKCDWALIYFCQILIGIVIGAMILLATGCAAEPPKQIVRTETVQVPVEVRVPIPAEYTADCVVTEPKPALGKYFTNGQVALMLDDYRVVLHKCNLDKQALRSLGASDEPSH